MFIPVFRGRHPKPLIWSISILRRNKGVAVVGTGDATHPGWFAEIKAKLVPPGTAFSG
jgi:PHP family Zn ribbon phosphoesterase